MFGFVYLFIVFLIGLCTWIERDTYRKQNRDKAYKEGHFDYRGFKGEQWYGDRRAGVLYKDGDECLVDLKDRNIVYINYTKEREKAEAERLRKSSEDSNKIYLMRAIGTYELGDTTYERTTDRPIKVKRNGNYFCKIYLYKQKTNGLVWYKEGEEIEISPEEYTFLSTGYWDTEKKRTGDGYGKEALLARKKFMDDNGIKLWDGNKEVYEIKYQTAEASFEHTTYCFAESEDEAKKFVLCLTRRQHHLEFFSIQKAA